jgi:hypothetical protein
MTKRRKQAKLSPTTTLGFLLKSHYLADDFPSVVTTSNFADYCVTNYTSLPTVEALLKRTTLYGTFSVPRTTTTRRVMALPHPASQLALSRIMADHRSDIQAAIDSSNITLYATTHDTQADRAFSGLDFKSKARKESEILARYPVITKADIANFFHTIYSHSLPWAVLGKQTVKDIREGKDKQAKEALEQHWASQIDVAIQRGNSRETFGIPVGPDTSRIIAEILLAGVQKAEPLAQMLQGRGAYRLVDDFFIGFEDESAARRCQDALRRVLWDYNLHLNETKTQIVHSSSVFDSEWKFEIDNLPIPKGSSKQYSGVERLLEITLRHCDARKDWFPAIFFCHRLLTLEIRSENFRFIRDCMLRVGRDFTMCLKFAAQFVINYRDLLKDDESQETIKAWARHILTMHSKREHDFEMAWILVICGVLGLSVDQAFIGLDQPVVSPVVLAILGLLSADKLLVEKWDEWRTPPPGTGSIANGRNWLPHYESVLRKWTNDAGIIKEINADPLFSQLLKAKVTFLDDADFLSKAGKVSPLRPPSVPSGIVTRTPVRSKRAPATESYE